MASGGPAKQMPRETRQASRGVSIMTIRIIKFLQEHRHDSYACAAIHHNKNVFLVVKRIMGLDSNPYWTVNLMPWMLLIFLYSSL